MDDQELDRVRMLVTACERDLGNPDLWFEPDGYPRSLALCIIDSIYSTGARYTSVRNVVERYRAYRAEQGGNADTDGIDDLRTTFEDLGGPMGDKNRQPPAYLHGRERPAEIRSDQPHPGLFCDARHQNSRQAARCGRHRRLGVHQERMAIGTRSAVRHHLGVRPHACAGARCQS